MTADYQGIGTQKDVGELCNCLHCGTTIVMTIEKEMKHLQEQHYNRWYEIQEQLKQRVAEKYLQYLNEK